MKMAVAQLSASIAFAELDIKDKLLNKFTSQKIDFGNFTKQAVQQVTQFIVEFDFIVDQFYEVLAKIEKETASRIESQQKTMSEFMMKAHGEFLHKSKSWSDAVEVVHCNKHFKDKVLVAGESSQLSSENVIEGIARGTYYEP